MMTPEFGSGLHEFLRTRSDHISGILNGIPVDEWDPSTDTEIEQNYSLKTIESRAVNKEALYREIGLPGDNDILLLAMVTRMVHQKGVDLALNALRMLTDVDWQLILLGTGEPVLEEDARRLQSEFPDRVRSIIRYDPGLARRLYAGADAKLIPSRYEPSGLTQMIAMRYGCVPVARATGGLRDTIFDYHSTNEGTGFLFNESSPDALAMTLRRALKVYEDKRLWQGIQRRGMQQDFSWERSARAYFDLYRSLVLQVRED
jgi:starch synthase